MSELKVKVPQYNTWISFRECFINLLIISKTNPVRDCIYILLKYLTLYLIEVKVKPGAEAHSNMYHGTSFKNINHLQKVPL